MLGGNSKLVALATAAILFISTPANAEFGEVAGVWQTEKLSEVTITSCTEGHCGYLSKIVVPPEIYAKNKNAIDQIGTDNLFDYKNKDPDLRNRPIKGLQILTLESRETPTTYKGAVYNPEDGNTYTGIVEVLDARTIRLTGCGFFDLICRSEDWVRVK
jgi:uncharacterized protein (DUF2147 family)